MTRKTIHDQFWQHPVSGTFALLHMSGGVNAVSGNCIWAWKHREGFPTYGQRDPDHINIRTSLTPGSLKSLFRDKLVATRFDPTVFELKGTIPERLFIKSGGVKDPVDVVNPFRNLLYFPIARNFHHQDGNVLEHLNLDWVLSKQRKIIAHRDSISAISMIADMVEGNTPVEVDYPSLVGLSEERIDRILDYCSYSYDGMRLLVNVIKYIQPKFDPSRILPGSFIYGNPTYNRTIMAFTHMDQEANLIKPRDTKRNAEYLRLLYSLDFILNKPEVFFRSVDLPGTRYILGSVNQEHLMKAVRMYGEMGHMRRAVMYEILGVLEFVADRQEEMLPSRTIDGDDLLAAGYRGPKQAMKSYLQKAYDLQLKGWDRDVILRDLRNNTPAPIVAKRTK